MFESPSTTRVRTTDKTDQSLPKKNEGRSGMSPLSTDEYAENEAKLEQANNLREKIEGKRIHISNRNGVRKINKARVTILTEPIPIPTGEDTTKLVVLHTIVISDENPSPNQPTGSIKIILAALTNGDTMITVL